MFNYLLCLNYLVMLSEHSFSHSIRTKSPLAELHDSSTMEHHHLNMALLILNTEGNNILENLSETEYVQAVSFLKHCILATDLVLHFKYD